MTLEHTHAKTEAKWVQVLQAAFERYLLDLKTGDETLFTRDAGERETEFYTDASEVYFCVPHDSSQPRETPRTSSGSAR